VTRPSAPCHVCGDAASFRRYYERELAPICRACAVAADAEVSVNVTLTVGRRHRRDVERAIRASASSHDAYACVSEMNKHGAVTLLVSITGTPVSVEQACRHGIQIFDRADAWTIDGPFPVGVLVGDRNAPV
jgi:hypothetical protein